MRNATRAQDIKETGGKGDMLMGKRETMPGNTTAGQNAMDGIPCKRYSKVVIDGGERGCLWGTQ